MAAFPYYDAGPDRGARTRRRTAMLDVFAARGYARDEPAVLQPAESSSTARARKSAAAPSPSPIRRAATLPAARSHHSDLPHGRWRAATHFPARLCYNGLAFRHQPAEPHRPTQFFQAGVELLGLEDRAAGEIEILSLAVEALRAAGLKDFDDADRRSRPVRRAGRCARRCRRNGAARLKRHFWRPAISRRCCSG